MSEIAPNVEGPWPSVETAYHFVLPSYQMMVSRFDAADTRLTALLTMTSSLTLGAPILARAVDPISHSHRDGFW
jgi:hypothetical protein